MTSPSDHRPEVTVLLFGHAAELAGWSSQAMQAATVRELRATLMEGTPSLSPVAESLLVAVDAAYVDDLQTLRGGEEVAFFPPVSGG